MGAVGRRRGRTPRAAVAVAAGMICAAASIVVVLRAPAAGASVQTNVVYGSDGGQSLGLDVYPSANGGTSSAAVIFVHGGGWAYGTKANDTHVAEAFAAAGFVSFSIDYSMTPPRFPREVNDVLSAVSWVRSHAAQYGVDPARIALLGDSSGANVVAMAGTNGSGSLTTRSRVAAVVSWSGPMDLVAFVGDPLAGCQGATCALRSRIVPTVENYLGCTLAACPSTYAQASPISQVDPSDPPMFLANSDNELMPLSQAQEMAAKLTAAGITYQLDVIPGDRHAIAYAGTAAGPSMSFLNQVFNAQGPSSSPPPTDHSSGPPSSEPSTPPSTHPSTGHGGGGGGSTSSSKTVPIVIGLIVALLVIVVLALSMRRSGPRARS